jgi:hypothetical protein
MKTNSQVAVSKRLLFIILAALLALSLFNTYLIIARTSGPADTSAISYDFVISQHGASYLLKNMLTGYSTDFDIRASYAINLSLNQGKAVYLNPGNYTLDQDVLVSNKLNAKIVSDGATILGNGHRIIVRGDNYTTSKYATISGLTLINASIRIEDSFATSISNIVFENSSVGIEFANINTWSEYNQISNCQFVNVTEGIVFRTPNGNATGSYASSEIDRCSFNIRDNSVGIHIEKSAQFSDRQLQNIRFWLGADGSTNQTGILNNGAMDQTLLQGVVFESFCDQPHDMFAIDLGQACDPAPMLDGAVNFLGNWTARIHNPYSKWISGVGSTFEKQNIGVPVGSGNQYGGLVSIQMQPLKIFTFKPEISVVSTVPNELVTVRIRFEYIDNVYSNSVEKTFNGTQSVWLSDADMMQLCPAQSVIWAVIVDAKSNQATSSSTVTVSGYGTAG